jgi:multiple sugar transport system ATP-binding protein
MVFQSYALYPHMSVRKNIAFPLRMAGLDAAEQQRRVEQAAQALNLVDCLDRRPGQLSGGQRQRVAIGRAIVRHPKVFLFDEPLSNLDASLRVDMRMEIARLHQDIGATMIYVTHDQIEAMTLADKIVVLDRGVVQQVGAPLDLYHNPKNLFVAGFIGSPKMNLLEVDRTGGDGANVVVASSGVKPVEFDAGPAAAGLAGKLTLGIRPQAIRLTEPAEAVMPAKARIVEHLGDETVISAQLDGGDTALVVVQGSASVRPGQAIGLSFDTADAHLFHSSGELVPTGRHL